MTIVALSNAATPRARRAVPELRDALPESPSVRHHVSDTAEAADAVIAGTDWRPGDVLVINGGDGSVQRALTLLLHTRDAAALPRIACLPGGSTNMTAFDLNEHRRYRDCLVSLRRLAANPEALPEAPRPVVRVESPGLAPAPCGLFFGAGTIVQGVEYFQTRLRGDGGRHELTAGAALARTLWGVARSEPPFDAPLAATVSAPPLWPQETPLSLRLLLATTLDRLFLGIRAYWGDGPGRLRTTAVEARAPGFLRRMPRLLRGAPDPDMVPAAGYHSGRVDALCLTFDGSFTLDGELFAGSGDRMRVGATDPVRFLPL